MLAAFPAARFQLTARLGVLSLGNNKGTHHEKSEDSGCARAARCSGRGERRSVIHLDSHERLRFPRHSLNRQRIRPSRRASTMPRSRAGTSAPGRATSTSATTRTSTTKSTCTRASRAVTKTVSAGTSASSTTRIPTNPTSTTPRSTASSTTTWFYGQAVLFERLRVTTAGNAAIYIAADVNVPLPAEFLDPGCTPATASATSGTAWTVSRARTTSTIRSASGYTVSHFDLALK